MDEALIIELGKKILGANPLQIKKKEIGICNEVYELTYESSSYILRMNKEKEWIYGTHKFLPIFQKLAIKVPSIIAEDYTKTQFPFCYQLQSKIEGKDLAIVFQDLSYKNLQSIAKEISRIFDQFNTLPARQDFGGLTGLNEEHIDSLLTIIKGKRKYFVQKKNESKVIDNQILGIFDELVNKYSSYFSNVQPKLYYDDLNSKNVMIHNGVFNGLVDLDFLTKGDYLNAIGGIIAAWFGTRSGEFYINEIIGCQKLDELQSNIVKVYAIFHLIGWTCEEGTKFNSNTNGVINWSNVEKKKRKIINLYQSIKN